ncbi:hypothetical protein LCGC14_0509350 [marine sediment metagenome]|uniref:Uncharacterized protein n=1 Tax=marine sediment metagenome TaxID=412755 RepID=A0A0F9S6D8_9ZZZZ
MTTDFDKNFEGANKIGTGAKIDEAVKVADKTFNDLQKAKLDFSSKKK